MKNLQARILSLLLFCALLFGLGAPVSAAEKSSLDAAIQDTAAYLCRTVKTPQVGSIGGEWAVFGLARSGYTVPENYYQDYYATVEAYVTACSGVLHTTKYTEYARVIVALASIGKDARNVAGYDLTKPLGDHNTTVRQGLNGPICALLALDSMDYPMPQNPEAETQATRQMYVDYILDRQLLDGGWSLTSSHSSSAAEGNSSDPDITGMALQALARYQKQPAVAAAIEKALDCISQKQDANGGFSLWGQDDSEGCVQILVALGELGLPLDDPRFVKNGNTVLDHLLTFYRAGGGFLHSTDSSGSSQMATEQGLYGLVAAQRAIEGKNSLYRMEDAQAIAEGGSRQKGSGLAGKDPAVQAVPITKPGTTFSDLSDNPNRTAIEALAARGIIDGKGNGLFDPDASMTRAEFSAIIVRALGLPTSEVSSFTDVPSSQWHAPYVGTAYTYGLVSGRGGGVFDPGGTITRQETAAMVARAARLCGMETELTSGEIRDILAQFTDYTSTDEWARAPLAFCYQADILSQSALAIQPKIESKRCEIAQMLFQLLGHANLL